VSAKINEMQQVDTHLQSVVDEEGRVDISFNGLGISDPKILGTPLVDMDVEQFCLPIATWATSYFLTARLAARRMVVSKSGVIMTVTTLHSRAGFPVGGRVRSCDGRQRGTHSRTFLRARASRHSRSRSATQTPSRKPRRPEKLSQLEPRRWE
jgi:NAD(P)-dependent dehydrogenase (short-subunit alcohol dehydrogenase family)